MKFKRGARKGIDAEVLAALEKGPVLLDFEEDDPRPSPQDLLIAWRLRQRRRESIGSMITEGKARLVVRGDLAFAELPRRVAEIQQEAE